MSTDWNKLTVAQLKTELTNRGLDTSGKKAELVERLESYIAENPDDAENGTAEEEMEGQEEEAVADGDGDEAVDEDALLADDGKEEDGGEEAMEDGDGDGEGVEGEGAEGEGEEDAEEKGEDEEEEEKKDDEPEEPDADTIIREIDVPEKNDMRKDRTREMRFRRVFVWPVEWNDLQSEVFKAFMDKCLFFTFRTLKEENGVVQNGSIEMQFRTCALAAEAAEKLKELREGVETKQLAPADTEESIRDIKGEKAEEVTDRLLYVSNLPEDVTDEAVEALFPGAQYVLVSRDREESRKCQGYAYIEYENGAQSLEALNNIQDLEIGEDRKLVVGHYGHQLIAMGNADLSEEKKNAEVPLDAENWWYYVKVLRGLKKRLGRDVKTMSMIEKKTFFRRLNTVNAKFEEDKKAREEQKLPAKDLPSDLQNKPKGQKRPRTFSGGPNRGGKQFRRGGPGGRGPPSLMEVGRGGRGGRGGMNNRNAMNLLMGIEQMLRQNPRGGARGGRGGFNSPRGQNFSYGGSQGSYSGGYGDDYNRQGGQGRYGGYNQGGYNQGGSYNQGGGNFRKQGFQQRGRGGRRW